MSADAKRTHHSLLITHYSSLITHHSLLITHYSCLLQWHSCCSSIVRYWRTYHEYHWMAVVRSHRRRHRQVPHAGTRSWWLDRHDSPRHRRFVCRRFSRIDSDGSWGADRGVDRLDHRRDRSAVHLSPDRRP